jgi:tRNA pseudouridine55 synthase
VKRLKTGHAGTLDPLATGVLILCTGKATKQIESLQYQTKEYTATLQLGATTASYDKEHTVNMTYPTRHITRELIEQTLPRFLGEIQQVPPEYSACSVGGDRAYKLARKGEKVELKAKTLQIDEIEQPRLMEERILFHHLAKFVQRLVVELRTVVHQGIEIHGDDKGTKKSEK